MLRRTFLTGCSLSFPVLAGCLGRWSDREVTVNKVDEVDDDIELNFDVEVTNSTMGGDETAEVELTLQNTASQERRIHTGNEPVFSSRRSDDDSLFLYTETDIEGATVSESGCWTVEESAAYTSEDMVITLTTDEYERVTRYVLGNGDVQSGSCPESGISRFSQPYTVYYPEDLETEDYADIDKDTFSWGFLVEIE